MPIVLWSILAIGVSCYVIFLIFWFLSFSTLTMPSQEKIQKYFTDNQQELKIVSIYIGSLEYDSIYINSVYKQPYHGEISVSDRKSGTTGKKIMIENQTALNAVRYLLEECGYSVITATDSEFVEFQKWSTRDVGCGIAYSLNGQEPEIEYVTELVPLDELGWYYYVSDFDAYRENQE